MVEYNDFSWKDNNSHLYLGKNFTGFKIGQSYEYPTMFHVIWPDGTFSKDSYNHTRAQDHCIKAAISHFNDAETAQIKAVGEFLPSSM